MSEQNEIQPTEDQPIAPEPVQEQEPAEETEQEPAGKEAAKYRRRLRETETERDTLVARVEHLQRSEVKRMADAAKIKPAALWAAGAELQALLDDDGGVDAEKVEAAITAAREALGIKKPGTGPSVPNEGRVPERSGPSGRDAMADLVAGR